MTISTIFFSFWKNKEHHLLLLAVGNFNCPVTGNSSLRYCRLWNIIIPTNKTDRDLVRVPT